MSRGVQRAHACQRLAGADGIDDARRVLLQADDADDIQITLASPRLASIATSPLPLIARL